MIEPILETQDLTIGYLIRKQPPRVVARDISLSLFAEEVVCLIGPNGAGKSTLLRTLCRLQPSIAGKITIEQRNLTSLSSSEIAKCISIVLTEQVNVGQLSVFALVALGRYPYTDWTGTLSQEDRRVIHWALDAVGAIELSTRHVSELSDGERQKVMIARALAQQPHTIILDEPTAFLDLPRRVEMMSLLRRLARETGTAILLSTHDLELSLRTADRLWLLTPGNTIETGAPEDLVLSGKLAQTFQSDGIRFDPQHGSFVLMQEHNGHISLHGNGLCGLWTRKALEREGFAVNESHNKDSLADVHVTDRQGTPSWTLQTANESTQHSSIHHLMLTLRNIRSHQEL